MKYSPLKFMGLHAVLQVNDDYAENDEIPWFLVQGKANG